MNYIDYRPQKSDPWLLDFELSKEVYHPDTSVSIGSGCPVVPGRNPTRINVAQQHFAYTSFGGSRAKPVANVVLTIIQPTKDSKTTEITLQEHELEALIDVLKAVKKFRKMIPKKEQSNEEK